MHDVIRVGIISSVDYEKGFVQVTYPDRENAVSGNYLIFHIFIKCQKWVTK